LALCLVSKLLALNSRQSGKLTGLLSQNLNLRCLSLHMTKQLGDGLSLLIHDTFESALAG
jgi:hypothetical protein